MNKLIFNETTWKNEAIMKTIFISYIEVLIPHFNSKSLTVYLCVYERYDIVEICCWYFSWCCCCYILHTNDNDQRMPDAKIIHFYTLFTSLFFFLDFFLYMLTLVILLLLLFCGSYCCLLLLVLHVVFFLFLFEKNSQISRSSYVDYGCLKTIICYWVSENIISICINLKVIF